MLALVNYYTRDLHGSAPEPQDILNLGTAAEVMGSYTLHITQTVITIALLYIPWCCGCRCAGQTGRQA